MNSFNCRLPDGDLQRVKDLAQADGVSITEWCRQAVRDRIAGTSTVAAIQRGFAEAMRDFQRDVAALDKQRQQELASLMGFVAERLTGQKPAASAPAANAASAAPAHLDAPRPRAGLVGNA
ncbi:hypothetical protein KDX26_19215 [Burkholderia cenocepacia]|uniref:hypothetical protein n=1 Tax=Burkholderia cenocepacia TaxID=95486 RepID=UPI001B9CB3C4|nr:hypothetical protein [Burkholderia cenocepacia]MBR8384529.1 hypothetical protein [Burkholderia cenocepacia]